MGISCGTSNQADKRQGGEPYFSGWRVPMAQRAANHSARQGISSMVGPPAGERTTAAKASRNLLLHGNPYIRHLVFMREPTMPSSPLCNTDIVCWALLLASTPRHFSCYLIGRPYCASSRHMPYDTVTVRWGRGRRKKVFLLVAADFTERFGARPRRIKTTRAGHMAPTPAE